MMGQLPADQNGLFYEFCLEITYPMTICCGRLILSSI